MRTSRLRSAILSTAITALVTMGGPPADAQPASLIEAVRTATAPFRDPTSAVAAGWIPLTGCVSGPQSGAMGTHYINPALVGDGQLDASRPEALIFARQGGRTVMVGAEFIVLAADWHASHEGPPVLLGQHFQFAGSPNRYGLPPFYELHVWAWKPNPNGTFSDWHAHVTCDEVSGQ